MPWGGTYNGGQYNAGDGNISHGDSTYGHAPEHVIAEVPLSYFSISDLTITEGDSGNVIISRTGGSKAIQTLTLTSSNDNAVAGSDYSAINQTVTFSADETSKTISISSIEDLSFESDETFTLTISSSGTDYIPVQISDAVGIVTISNDDSLPLITGPSGDSGDLTSNKSINENSSFVHTLSLIHI